jgi:hypothetical protein
MADLNFPTNPSLDETYIANNVIYTWNGEYWEANTTNGFDSRYVEVAGDNMTGNLTLGTDKITLNADGAVRTGKLNASAGTSSFVSGSSNSISHDVGNTDALLVVAEASDGLGIRIQNTSNSPSTTGATQALRIKSNAGGSDDYKASIGWDGSAEFAGSISTKDFTLQDNNFGCYRLLKTSTQAVLELKHGNGATAGSDVIGCYSGDEKVAKIGNDGSAEFAGDVVCSKLRANGPAWDNQFDSNGVLVYLVTTDATRKLLKAASNNGGAATEQFSVSATGQIAAKQTTIQPISSERRLKENIVAIDADTAWETIKSTPYYTYNFIDSDVTSYGPMADEVPAEMVVQPMEENEAGVMVARSDDEGPIRTYDNGMLQARLYTALQTALTRIEALEAEVTALKGTSTTDI